MKKIRIQDDLYTFVNQEKLEQLVIPDDQPCTGGFNTLAVGVEQLMMKEFNEMTSSNAFPNEYLKNACKLFEIANQSSKKEQDAINCERDVEKMKKAQYMENHIGERFEGVISGVCEFGFFVELINTVEGLVRLDSLKGDYYVYNKELNAILGKNSKNKYMYGDKVVVEVIKASRETAQVDFEIIKENSNGEKKEKKTKTKKN